MMINNKFKAQTLTGNPTGNYRCQHLASRALNMSCSFSQSARSIESRCVVIPYIILMEYLAYCVHIYASSHSDIRVRNSTEQAYVCEFQIISIILIIIISWIRLYFIMVIPILIGRHFHTETALWLCWKDVSQLVRVEHIQSQASGFILTLSWNIWCWCVLLQTAFVNQNTNPWLCTIHLPIGVGVSRRHIPTFLNCMSRLSAHARWLHAHVGYAIEHHREMSSRCPDPQWADAIVPSPFYTCRIPVQCVYKFVQYLRFTIFVFLGMDIFHIFASIPTNGDENSMNPVRPYVTNSGGVITSKSKVRDTDSYVSFMRCRT